MNDAVRKRVRIAVSVDSCAAADSAEHAVRVEDVHRDYLVSPAVESWYGAGVYVALGGEGYWPGHAVNLDGPLLDMPPGQSVGFGQ